MSDKQPHTIPSLPVSNYSSAIARAVEWLGDRYLLASPINTTLTRRQSAAIHRNDRVAVGISTPSIAST
jgi:hypothetical protein